MLLFLLVIVMTNRTPKDCEISIVELLCWFSNGGIVEQKEIVLAAQAPSQELQQNTAIAKPCPRLKGRD